MEFVTSKFDIRFTDLLRSLGMRFVANSQSQGQGFPRGSFVTAPRVQGFTKPE